MTRSILALAGIKWPLPGRFACEGHRLPICAWNSGQLDVAAGGGPVWTV
jgi:hypothetical protein